MAYSALIRKPGTVALMISIAALRMSTAVSSVGAAQGQGPCADDVQKFCKTFSRARGALLDVSRSTMICRLPASGRLQ